MTRASLRRWSVVAATTALAGVVAYAVSPWGLSRTQAHPAGPIVLATGQYGGLSHTYGLALAALAGDDLAAFESLVTGGSLDNMDLLGRGTATFALATADVVEAYLDAPIPTSSPPPPTDPALTATAPSGPTPACAAVIGTTATAEITGPTGVDPATIRAVARLYDSYVHLIVAESAPVNRLADLRGLRVSVGAPGSGTALVADRILTQAGIDPRDGIGRLELTLDQTIAALRARCIDAFFVVEGLAALEVERVTTMTSVRFIDLADVASEDYGPAYHVGDIPGGTYPGQPVAFVTVAVPTLLLTAETTGDDVVRAMTDLLFTSAPTVATGIKAVGQIDRHAAIFTSPVPLHDGARAYYRATKVAA